MGGSLGVSARHAQQVAAAGLLQLSCRNQRLWEEYAVGVSPWITAEEATISIASKCDKL